MDEDGRTFHLLVVDHKLVCEEVLVRVHRFRMELDTTIFLGPQFRVTGDKHKSTAGIMTSS